MSIYSGIKEGIQRKLIKQIIVGLGDASNENILRLANIFEKLPMAGQSTKASVKFVKNLIVQNHPAINLIKRILREMDPHYRDVFIDNFIIHGLLLNQKKRSEAESRGEAVPFTVLISPTMRCNLACVGCYAGNYSKKDDMSFEVFDRIVSEGEAMGSALFTILGGEPFVVKDELFSICRKHNKAFFQVYTNGTLITEEVADEMLKLGNIVPMISLEGFEKETDLRRGKGVYQKVMKTMDLLKKKGIPFGYSIVPTRKNIELITSDKFIDFMINKGAFIGWHFLYMPVGKEPDLRMMPTPEQRKYLNDRWYQIRNTKPIFVIDFWNDAPIVGGCIAGKFYIHITSNGDVEPCIFTHFAVDNIKNKSLKEVMHSEFFKELRARQPYHDNLYMPCMWIDHPEVGREIITKHKCYPTHEGADTILKSEKIKKGLDKYSKEVAKIYAPEWEKYKKEKEKARQESKC